MVPAVTKELHGLGYCVLVGTYAPGQVLDQSFRFVVGHRLRLVESYMYWFTSTPRAALSPSTRKSDPLLREWGEQYEKGALVCEFEWGSSRLVYALTHFGLRERPQRVSAEMLARHLDSYGPDVAVVLAGDFNTFNEYEGRALLPLAEAGFIHLQMDAPFTFINYPYDLGVVPRGELDQVLLDIEGALSPVSARARFLEAVYRLHDGPLTSTLDHVFTRNVEKASCRVDLGGICPETLHDVYKFQAESGQALTASDHMPTVVDVYGS
jgi:endonuclease/exonuclease/phosphatase family metal-dependent hydrolase